MMWRAWSGPQTATPATPTIAGQTAATLTSDFSQIKLSSLRCTHSGLQITISCLQQPQPMANATATATPRTTIGNNTKLTTAIKTANATRGGTQKNIEKLLQRPKKRI